MREANEENAEKVDALRRLLGYVRERFEYASPDVNGASWPIRSVDDHDLDEALEEAAYSVMSSKYVADYVRESYRLFHIDRGECGFQKFLGFVSRGVQSSPFQKVEDPPAGSERLLMDAVALVRNRLDLAVFGQAEVDELTAYLSDVIALRSPTGAVTKG